MVTLSLFDTILSLHCEDLMLELLLKYLLPCQHVPISQRYKINQVTPYALAVNNFLELAPEVMKHANYSPLESEEQQQSVSKTIGANWNHYGLHTGDSLYNNYHAYLFEARNKIGQCKSACQQEWSSPYSYQRPRSGKRGNKHTIELMRSFLEEFDSDHKHPAIEGEKREKAAHEDTSLNSLGETSSGYESFKNRLDDDDQDHHLLSSSSSAEEGKRREVWKLSSNGQPDSLNVFDLDFSEDLFTQGTVNLGTVFWININLAARELFAQVFWLRHTAASVYISRQLRLNVN